MGAVHAGLALLLGASALMPTGSGVRVKAIGVLAVKVYELSHEMAAPLPARDRTAVIAAEVDKRFVLTLQRDLPAAQLRDELRQGLARNGFADAARAGALLAALGADLREGAQVTLSYDAAKKATTLRAGAGSATVAGADLMRAVWGVWLGNTDQPALADALVARLPPPGLRRLPAPPR